MSESELRELLRDATVRLDEQRRMTEAAEDAAERRLARAERAEARLRRVEALHRPDPTGDWCDHCWTGPDSHGNGPSPEWPCATIRAIRAALEENK